MMPRRLVCVLAVMLAFFAALEPARAAETVACPDLAQARPVGDCPTEEQLRYSYLGYCGDDRRMYENDNVTCTAFERYRDLKNIVLWESADGAFQGYVSCALAPETVRTLKPFTMAASRQGALVKLVCAYPKDVALTRRSKTPCTVAKAECGPDGTACQARCD
ncbi:MAG: hypothetical protein IT565_06880 [Rhodospirillales bacterium]|nr:hypothetical protein [Rhodospirillales bacterium]